MMGHLGQCSSIHRHCSLQNCDMWTPANFNQFWLKAASPFRILAWAKIGLVKLSFMPVKVRFFHEGERRSSLYTTTTPRSGTLETLNTEKTADLVTGCDLLIQITTTALRCAD